MVRSLKSSNDNVDFIKVNVLNYFIIIGLLRLTNFNFYVSQWVGFETAINATGGDAFNFINYLAAISLVMVFVGKYGQIGLDRLGFMLFSLLIILYILNACLAPYANPIWLFYQLIFIFISVLLYAITRKCSEDFTSKFYAGSYLIFWGLMVYIGVFTLYILSQYSIQYYFTEFNDAFVNSLNEFGIMKQRHGYLLGFVLAYALFMLPSKAQKILPLVLIMFAGIGIRSFVLGCLGSIIIFTVHKRIYRIGWLSVLGIFIFLLFQGYFDHLIYDTRYYSYLNALMIVKEYPMGVGLGGYPVFTEIFSNSLFAQFYDVNALLDYVPTAPESDLVHLFGSLGLVCGLIHLCIQLRIVILSTTFRLKLVPFEKCVLFYFAFMTFFGISEDSMFSVNYWIFFGIAAGIVSNVYWRTKSVS